MFEKITHAVGTITNDIAALKSFLADVTSEWAIVRADDYKSAVEFNVFMNMDVSGENKIISSPTEEGSFVMYNKTNSPLSIGLQVAIKGDPAVLAHALHTLIEMSKGTTLVNVITPEREYENFNIFKFAFTRKNEDGIDIIFCDLGLQEIRQVASAYTNVKVPKTQKRGRQQAQEESFISKAFS